MSTNLERSTMENSTILREIADFDINAPISVSISFEDDFDIKTEIEDQEITNSAFVPILEPKPENEADKLAPCTFTDDKTSDFTAHKNLLDTSALQPKCPQNKLSTSDDTLRKRKSVEVQITKPKRNKTISDSADNNDCDEEIPSETLASHTQENHIQTGPSVTTSENAKHATFFETILPSGSTDNQSDPNLDGNGLHQTDINKISKYVLNCLATLSENMRRIMQAFEARRRQQISMEDFIKVKLLHFKSSYKTVVTIFVPEENNNEFISTFLKETLQRARVKSGFYFMHTYQDYANLLVEMIGWTKNQPQQSQKLFKNSEQPMPVQKSVITEPQVNKNTAQNNFQVSNSNTERDKICIFSSGPPERALTINIDPRLNKYLETPTQHNSMETNKPLRGTFENAGDMTQGKTAVEGLKRFVVNNNKTSHQSATQPTLSQIPNPVKNHQQHPNLPNSPSYSTTNMSHYSIPSQQMRDSTPVLRMQLGKTPLQSHLTHPVESQRPPPRFGNSQHFAPQMQPMPPPPYDQSRHLQTKAGPQQQILPQYNQAPVLQTQSTPTQYQQSQYLQAQLGPQYIHVQSQQLQSQLGQSHLLPEYNQITPRAGVSQQVSQQYKQQPHPHTTEDWPSLAELLSTKSTLPLPYPNEQLQSGLSGQWHSRNQQPQVQPPAYQTEWQQGLNATFQAGQVPQQTQKGSARSASTDSGFISPLNFNVSTDQTMPTMPQEPESPLPMIVHVTSLSDKASYVELGKCEVCKKITKQMCMGCMKIYYCNYECQTNDWAAHAPNCTQQNAN